MHLFLFYCYISPNLCFYIYFNSLFPFVILRDEIVFCNVKVQSFASNWWRTRLPGILMHSPLFWLFVIALHSKNYNFFCVRLHFSIGSVRVEYWWWGFKSTLKMLLKTSGMIQESCKTSGKKKASQSIALKILRLLSWVVCKLNIKVEGFYSPFF